MQDINKMIGDGNLMQALTVLIGEGFSDAIILKAQLENAEKNYRLGLIGHDDKQNSVNRILFATLEMAKKSPGQSEKPMSREMPPAAPKAIESWLLNVISQNKRRNQTLYDDAQDLLKRYRDYQDQKAENPAFDPSGRRIESILKSIQDFKTKIEETGKDQTENTVARITTLISERVPTYEQLQEAYNLAVGRGMSNKTVERLLEARANDEEPRIQIAEAIELFLSKI